MILFSKNSLAIQHFSRGHDTIDDDEDDDLLFGSRGLDAFIFCEGGDKIAVFEVLIVLLPLQTDLCGGFTLTSRQVVDT